MHGSLNTCRVANKRAHSDVIAVLQAGLARSIAPVHGHLSHDAVGQQRGKAAGWVEEGMASNVAPSGWLMCPTTKCQWLQVRRRLLQLHDCNVKRACMPIGICIDCHVSGTAATP